MSFPLCLESFTLFKFDMKVSLVLLNLFATIELRKRTYFTFFIIMIESPKWGQAGSLLPNNFPRVYLLVQPTKRCLYLMKTLSFPNYFPKQEKNLWLKKSLKVEKKYLYVLFNIININVIIAYSYWLRLHGFVLNTVERWKAHMDLVGTKELIITLLICIVS